MFLVGGEELSIALPGVPVLPCRFGSAQSFTLTVDQHGELLGDFILFGDGQHSVLADQLLGLMIKLHLLASCGQRTTEVSAQLWPDGGNSSNPLWRYIP